MPRLLRKTGDTPSKSLWQRVRALALRDVGALVRGGAREATLEDLEQLLLEADFGVPVTLKLIAQVEDLAKRGRVRTPDDFQESLIEGITASLRAGNVDTALATPAAKPMVLLVVGINGAGKTTLIGKLSSHFRAQGKSVMVAAGDTFRAGAIAQLKVWAERTGAEFVAGQPGGDPAAVAFDAVGAAMARAVDVLIVDTAGRLHTSDALMDELRKVARVIGNRMPGAPHETLLVLDGTIGQNAVAQARTFASAVPVSGLVVTKLDGTARGGVVVAVHEAINVPVKFLGTGEQAADLAPFDAATFARELLSDA